MSFKSLRGLWLNTTVLMIIHDQVRLGLLLGLLLIVSPTSLFAQAHHYPPLIKSNVMVIESDPAQQQSDCDKSAESCSTPPLPEKKPAPPEERHRLKAKLESLLLLNFDYGQYIINLTPHPEFAPEEHSLQNAFLAKNHESLVYGDFRNGFQKTVYGFIEAGMGSQVRFWFSNMASWSPSFWAFVGVLPVMGKETESTRYVSTLEKAYAMSARHKIPESSNDLEKWDPGDSITYIASGGIVFTASVGAGPIGVGGARLAQGIWETYVEKIGTHQVYVKFTATKLQALSVFGTAAIITIANSNFSSADDGFSYLFDLDTELGRKAYEDMIHGNVFSISILAADKPQNYVETVPVQKVESFRTVASGSMASKALLIPIIWNSVYSKGRIHSFTTSDLNIEKTTTKVHYGIFTTSEDSRFWRTHKEKDVMFYGAKYFVDNWGHHTHMEGMFGNYSYAFRHDNSSGERLRDGIEELIKKTGLEYLRLNVPESPDLGYTGIEFNIKFNEENTRRLIQSAYKIKLSQLIQTAQRYANNYFQGTGDIYLYCHHPKEGASIQEAGTQCLMDVTQRTDEMVGKMYNALKKMGATVDKDPKAFTAAYGEFGEAMAENAFTFKLAMNLAGPGAVIDYLIEGTMTSMYFRRWITTQYGNWIPIKYQSHHGGQFDPQVRHSKARGVITGQNFAIQNPHLVFFQ